MFLLSLLSGSLMMLPIAVTVGLYIGIEHQRLFSNSQSAGAGILGSGRGQLKTTTYCQKSFGITPEPGRYTFNPNQWGDNANTGYLCMNITTNTAAAAVQSDNDNYAPPWTVTWLYPRGPAEQPVHAFPNAKLHHNTSLPARLDTIKSIPIHVAWSYAIGSTKPTTTNNADLQLANVNANAAIDMFVAKQQADSMDPTAADYEIMVWLGRWGLATDPIGIAKGSQATQSINGTTFDLYSGANGLGQSVYTWVASENTTVFAGDIFPLVDQLAALDGPKSTAYLGYLSFGSETLFTPENVTFSCPTLQLAVNT